MKKIYMVVGARPNFIKASAIYNAFKKYYPDYFKVRVVHTGQHFDNFLSDNVVKSVNLPIHHFLNSKTSERWQLINSIGSDMKLYNPDLVIVFGDVNSSFAGAWVAKVLGFKIAHIEAGLRSGLWNMPEEMNRYYIDSISDFLFVSEESGLYNINNEFYNKEKKYVGNVMIDTLLTMKNDIVSSHNDNGNYAVATMHRAENINNLDNLLRILKILISINKIIPLNIYAHSNLVNKISLLDSNFAKELHDNIGSNIERSLPYDEFVKKIYHSKFVITDSGGIQEEACAMNVPCITYREKTERPITQVIGDNHITQNKDDIINLVNKYKDCNREKIWNDKSTEIYWGDGRASERIVNFLYEKYFISE